MRTEFVYGRGVSPCGVCFSTLEAFHKFTSKHTSCVHSSGDIPWHELPASHKGNNQMSLPLPQN
ncbi:hypothetical protein D9D26_24410 [Escherichia coli]|nr:hypothetical protein [Escherichia coli]